MTRAEGDLRAPLVRLLLKLELIPKHQRPLLTFFYWRPEDYEI